jgi:hypothetical protein
VRSKNDGQNSAEKPEQIYSKQRGLDPPGVEIDRNFLHNARRAKICMLVVAELAVAELAGGPGGCEEGAETLSRRGTSVGHRRQALESEVKSKWAAAYMALHPHTSSPFL